MALTWREVTAPKLDTRDLAYAGQAIGASFDKLGDMFVKREQNLRAEATDAAIARALANSDPNQKLDLTGLDKRVNAKELAVAANAHINGLIQREQQREELLDQQALAQFGKYNTLRAKNILDGVDEFAGVSAEDLANPAWSRYLGQVDKSSLFDERIDNQHQTAALQETARGHDLSYKANMAQVGVQQQRLAMERDRYNRQLAEETAAKKLGTDAVAWTERYLSHPRMRQMTPDQALIELKKTDTWAKMSPERRGVIGQLIKPRAEELQALPEQYALPGRSDYGNLRVLADQLSGKADAAIGMVQRDAMRNNPGAYFISLAQDKKYADATPASVAAAYDKLGYNFANDRYFSKGYLNELMTGPRGVPAPVVMAALESSIHQPWWGSGADMRQLMNKLEDAYYNQNETSKTQTQIATESGKFSSLTARKDALLEQARIEQATEQTVSPKTKAELARIEKDLERAVGIYNTAKGRKVEK